MFLSLGAQFQHRGVVKVEARTVDTLGKGLSGRQLALLLARPSWVIGTVMLGLAITFQLGSLYFAPIIVVQPLGAYFVQNAYATGPPDLVIAVWGVFMLARNHPQTRL